MARLVAMLVGLLLFANGAAAQGQSRLALVIGNSDYSAAGLDPLANAQGDARFIASRLEVAGFDTRVVLDADLAGFRSAISEFGRSLREAPQDTVGLFFYAGHAVQSFGRNYLIPTDGRLSDQADLDLVAIDAASVLRQMGSARNRTNIVVLDACRDNPFEHIPDFSSSGLAEMRAPPGTFLSFATAPGEVAFDGTGTHSPFTTALADEMMVRGAPLEEVFRKVRVEVMEATLGKQVPWDTSSLTREFAFLPASTDNLAAEARAFSRAQDAGSADAYAAFVDAFPDSVFVEAARAEIAAIEGPSADETAPQGETAVAALPGAGEGALRGSGLGIGFAVPLREGDEGVAGRSIQQLVAGSPLFAPIEGLPEEVWRGQTCTSCHQWEASNLCTQAKTYLAKSAEEVGSKPHPYGGSFKKALRAWAEAGCP